VSASGLFGTHSLGVFARERSGNLKIIVSIANLARRREQTRLDSQERRVQRLRRSVQLRSFQEMAGR